MVPYFKKKKRLLFFLVDEIKCIDISKLLKNICGSKSRSATLTYDQFFSISLPSVVNSLLIVTLLKSL